MNTVDDTSSRLARLEKSHRRLRIFVLVGGLGLLGASAGVVECFRERSDLGKWGLTTTGLTILDQDGNYLSSIGNIKQRPYFKFRDRAGMVRMWFTLGEAGPELTLSDAAGRPRLRLSAQETGGSFETLEADGRTRWSSP